MSARTSPRLLSLGMALGCMLALSGSARAKAGPAKAAWVPKVAALRLEGCTAYPHSRLWMLFKTRAPRWWFWKGEYLQEVFEKDLQRLEDYYHRRGYRQAEVEDKEALLDRKGREVRLTVWFYEGPLNRIHSIRWKGASVFNDASLRKFLTVRPGDPLDADRLDASVRAVLRAYAARGYLEAVLQPILSWDKAGVECDVSFELREGPLCRLKDIWIDGLQRTKDWVVRREFRMRNGDPLSLTKLETAQQRLYLTGIFQSLYVRPVTVAGSAPGTRDIQVDVQENKAREINLSGGWGSVDRFHGQVEALHNNLLGRARHGSLKASAGRIIQHGEINYGSYWTAGVPWYNNANGFLENQFQPGYDLRRVGGIFTFGRTLSTVSKFQVSYRHENAYLANVKLVPAPDISTNFVRSFNASLILDERDSFTNPKKGLYLSSYAEMSGSFLDGTDTFIKTDHQIRLYRSLTPTTVLAGSAELGWVTNYRSSKPIALTELFFAGGPNVLRGFRYREAGPQDSQGLPVGGQFEVLLNVAEVRQKVWKFLGVAGFFDAGNVFSTVGRFRFSGIRTTGGWGLRIETRLGILRADQGFIVNPRPGERRQLITISVGQAF